MPTLKIINSIKVDVYSREHLPPHFHAIYAEFEELIIIESLETYAGKLPPVQRKRVINWATDKKEFLLMNFRLLNPRL